MCNDEKRPNDFEGVWDQLQKVYKAAEDGYVVSRQLDKLDKELRELAEAFDPEYRANVMNSEVDMEAAASMILEGLGRESTLKDIAAAIYDRAHALLHDPGDRRLVADVFAMCLAWSAARGTPIDDLAMSAYLRNRRKSKEEQP